MTATIPAQSLGLRGQCVKQVKYDDERNVLVFHCDRDRRFIPVDQRTGARGTVNRLAAQPAIDRATGTPPMVHGGKSAIAVALKQHSALDALATGAKNRGWDGCRHVQALFVRV